MSLIVSPTYSSCVWRKFLAAMTMLGVFGFLVFPHRGSQNIEQPEETNVTNNRSYGDTSYLKLSLSHETYSEDLKSRTSETYCTFKQCQTIHCSHIPIGSDPGKVTSTFIENEFKTICTGSWSIKLILDNCSLNKLHQNWLQTNVSIEELTLDSCSLSEIEDDAFSLNIYEETKKISIVGNKIRSLRKAAFRHLPNLQELTVRNNVIKYAEFDLLREVAGTLRTLELDGAIDTSETLRNITGGSTLLKVQILSIRENILPVIDQDIFTAVPEVQSLYIDNSKVKHVTYETFQPMSRSILLLIISKNDISTLPEGIFDSLIYFNRQFRLAADDNPWHCDCKLKWMQEFIKKYPSTVTTIPICKTPKANALLSFTKADFCSDENITVTSTTIRSIIVTTPKDVNRVTTEKAEDKDTIIVPCLSTFTTEIGYSKNLLSMPYFHFRSRFQHFDVAETLYGTLLVKLPNLTSSMTLLWYENDDYENSIRCVTSVKNVYILDHVQVDTTYAICLLVDDERPLSPFNCLSVTTRPIYGARAWLTNNDKTMIYSLFVILVLLFSCASALLTFILIRRHPSLLRGSKRIILLRRRNLEAFVLPRGVQIDNDEDKTRNENVIPPSPSKSNEDGYVTPLPPTRPPTYHNSMLSRMSFQSDCNGYVSGVEQTRMSTWRLKDTSKIEPENEKIDLPPIPPRRNIPSLSMMVDSNDENPCDCSA